MERNLALEVVRVTEAAALASARFMGLGDETAADMAAIEAMRRAFDAIAIDGTVVIGEGPQDAMAMLYVGERVGTGQGPATDVALDALEGAAICAAGGYNPLSGIAIADHGTFLRVPDTYMEKIACGPEGRGAVDLDRSPTANLRALAEAKGVYVENLTVAILDRPDRKSTRLNSSHTVISYAVFGLKKKNARWLLLLSRHHAPRHGVSVVRVRTHQDVARCPLAGFRGRRYAPVGRSPQTGERPRTRS